MPIKIHFLQAGTGDSIFLEFTNEQETTTLLIDGGHKKTYSQCIKGVLEDSYSKNKESNYILATHIDEDHINGIVQLFNSNPDFENCISEMLYNSREKLDEYAGINLSNINEPIISDKNKNTGVRRGIELSTLLSKKELLSNHKLVSCSTFMLNNVKITILTPRQESLKKYKDFYDKEATLYTSSTTNDWHKSLTELEDKEFKEEKSISNASSISILCEFENKKLLFLGDALPSCVVKTLGEMGYSNKKPLNLDLVKISHHGGKGNTSDELLELICTNKFLISTKGKSYGHPTKEVLSRIINKNSQCELIFNYDIAHKIFTIEEIENGSFDIYYTNEMEL